MTRAWSHPRSCSASRVCPHPASILTSQPRGRLWGTWCSNYTFCPPSLAPGSPVTSDHTWDIHWPRRPGPRIEGVSASAGLPHCQGDISSCPSWDSLSHEAAAGAEESAGLHVSPPSHSGANWQLKAESESREEMILTTEYSQAMGTYSQHFPPEILGSNIWIKWPYFRPNEGSFLRKGFFKKKIPTIQYHYWSLKS